MIYSRTFYDKGLMVSREVRKYKDNIYWIGYICDGGWNVFRQRDKQIQLLIDALIDYNKTRD